MMDEVRYIYNSDVLIKSNIAKSAHAKGGCKSGLVGLPSDALTRKERLKLNGDIKSYKINAPMTWDSFVSMPDDLKTEYLNYMYKYIGASVNDICKMFGVSRLTLSKILTMMKPKYNFNGRNHGNTQKWIEFINKPQTEDVIKMISEKSQPETDTLELSNQQIYPMYWSVFKKLSNKEQLTYLYRLSEVGGTLDRICKMFAISPQSLRSISGYKYKNPDKNSINKWTDFLNSKKPIVESLEISTINNEEKKEENPNAKDIAKEISSFKPMLYEDFAILTEENQKNYLLYLYDNLNAASIDIAAMLGITPSNLSKLNKRIGISDIKPVHNSANNLVWKNFINGEWYTLSLDIPTKPIKYDEFNKLSSEQQRAYLLYIKYKCGGVSTDICDMFEISNPKLTHMRELLNISYSSHPGRDPKKWEAFLGKTQGIKENTENTLPEEDLNTQASQELPIRYKPMTFDKFKQMSSFNQHRYLDYLHKIICASTTDIAGMFGLTESNFRAYRRSMNPPCIYTDRCKDNQILWRRFINGQDPKTLIDITSPITFAEFKLLSNDNKRKYLDFIRYEKGASIGDILAMFNAHCSTFAKITKAMTPPYLMKGADAGRNYVDAEKWKIFIEGKVIPKIDTLIQLEESSNAPETSTEMEKSLITKESTVDIVEDPPVQAKSEETAPSRNTSILSSGSLTFSGNATDILTTLIPLLGNGEYENLTITFTRK